MLRAIVIATALLSAATSTPLSPHLVVREALSTIPPGFSASGPAPADTVLHLRFALAQGNTAALEAAFYDISTPGRAAYGQHLTSDALAAYVRPAAETDTLVRAWLAAHKLEAAPVSLAGDVLAVELEVGRANALLGADFRMFTEDKSGRRLVRTLAYALPAELRGLVEHVHPTITFDLPPVPRIVSPSSRSLTARLHTAVNASCYETTTPACIQALYGIPTALATQPANKLFVSGFEGQWANQEDLTEFLSIYRPDIHASAQKNFSVISVSGGTNNQTLGKAGVEANLDIQYTVGLASGVPTTFVTVGPGLGNFPPDQFFLSLQDEANYILNMTDPPTVLTSSYSQPEINVSEALAKTICNLYMQLGARGVTVLFSSGDDGFGPTFPGTCPYITSVGGTQLNKTTKKEKAALFGGGGSSGGGFSNYFPTPAYQSSSVAAYIAHLNGTLHGA
ncbi:hypothetical protein HWV62_10216 [Athelia sp. TMB]|nr:hypothetical protein HWV62_10216 [Athelia sp. TMB]